ncbi:type I restriction enzyme, S subunit [Vibrio crassostreae]|nr:type I restriction enzyme, S subunit [Vibrio crassostreae]CAK2019659.1 type I restriction enzyme, S subunit [Vibrio crassostreae]CAK2822453.1 type I restriction enzyme, S subunit [Vibrio crassostreae]CAK3329192.1 type I restriction enzyme, S subunit [Vibrio crassostreae]CAK3919941.1 type I restriction enzyme, S subunit [Vibrio crassostreae]
MNCNWPELIIDELKSSEKGSIAMGPFGSRIKAENFVKSGVPVLKGGNLHGAYIDDNECDYLTEEKADELKSSNAFEGDIVITHRGTIGQVSIIPKGATYNRYVVSQSQLKVSLDKEKVNPYYVNYFLRSRIGQHRLLSYASQVGVPAIAKASTSVKQIQVPCPPLAVQDEIVSFLQSLDHKLTVNNQINQSLEEMAQAIFKSWFVDFDPVKAKMNGAQPEGMDAATASLFPEKLVESELGLIPEGWEIKPIKDLCSKVQNGGTPKRSESSYWDDGDIPWLTSGEVRQSIITSVENRITQLGLDKSSAKWVPELSTLVALYGATAGEVSLTSIPLTTNQAVCALMPKKEHQWYNYLQLKNRVAELAGKAVGSAQQNISKGLVESTEVLSVPESLLEAFNAQVESFFKLRICNLQENVELANLRDTLLPKLLSGEIDLEMPTEN